MIEVATVEHFARLRLQPMQAAFAALLDDQEYVREIVARGAWAATVGERVLGVAGFVDQGGGRAHAWALLAKNIARGFLELHHATLRQLDRAPYRRIELVTWHRFCNAHHWAKLLGFMPEAELEAWFPDGSAGILWKRVRPWPR